MLSVRALTVRFSSRSIPRERLGGRSVPLRPFVRSLMQPQQPAAARRTLHQQFPPWRMHLGGRCRKVLTAGARSRPPPATPPRSLGGADRCGLGRAVRARRSLSRERGSAPACLAVERGVCGSARQSPASALCSLLPSPRALTGISSVANEYVPRGRKVRASLLLLSGSLSSLSLAVIAIVTASLGFG